MGHSKASSDALQPAMLMDTTHHMQFLTAMAQYYPQTLAPLMGLGLHYNFYAAIVARA